MANHKIEIDLKVNDDDLDGMADKLKKVEKNVKGAMDGSRSSVNQMNNSISNMDKYFEGINSTASKFGLNTVKTFSQMTNAEKQTALGIIDINEGVSNITNAWDRMSQSTLKWPDHVKLAQTHVKGLGVETNSLKGKVMTASLAFSSKLGSSIESVKRKFAPLTSRIDSLKQKLASLRTGGGAFNNLKTGAEKANKSIGMLGATISNFAAMFLYDFAMGIVQAGKAAITASSQVDYFAGRLKKMESDVGKFDVSGFKKGLGELQKEFRKVDMTAVGASAEELAVKLKLPADSDSMKNLSETIAVTSSAFVKEGRTQEDAILAVSDALDGQFMKLKELGIGQDELKKNGWSGDLNDKKTLIEGLNKTLDELGFTQTAKDITTLDDAMGALTIAGGQLMQKVLVPLTPILIGAVEAFIGVTDAIGPVIDGLTNLPDGAKLALGFGALAIALGLLVPAISAVDIATIPLIGTLYSLAAAEYAISWPVLAVVAAIGLLAVAVYELGKYFGWWSDVPSMIDAIKGGILRLWDAFVNNPNVQGFIKDLTNLWNGLCDALSPVVDWAKQVWNEMFPPVGGEVDVVRMIIDAFGQLGDFLGKVVNAAKGAWNALNGFTGVVGVIINPIATLVEALRSIVCILLGCSPGIVPALQRVQEMFSSVFSFIAGFIGSVVNTIVSVIMTIVTAVQNVITIFSLFLNGQISLTDMIVMLWNNFSSMFVNILNILVGFVSGWGNRILQIIISTVQSWINNAVSKARNLVNQVYTALSSLPGKVRSALSGIAEIITAPFRNAWNTVSPWINKIKDGVNFLNDHMPSFGFEGVSFGFTGESFGFDGFENLETLNTTLTNVTGNDLANQNNITNNFNINGIIEEEASEYIVGAVNDHIRKQNLRRGV